MSVNPLMWDLLTGTNEHSRNFSNLGAENELNSSVNSISVCSPGMGKISTQKLKIQKLSNWVQCNFYLIMSKNIQWVTGSNNLRGNFVKIYFLLE